MTWIVTLHGRRGTYGTGLALVARLGPRGRWDAAAFCVAGVALCDIDLHFVWQAWHLMTWIVTLRGRRGTYGTGLALVARLGPRGRWDAAAFCVAGVALCDIDLHFVWQAWHFVTWELYAGSARLTKACQDVGVRSVAVDKDPNRSHGTKIFSCDVTQPGELETLRTFLRAEKDSLAWVPRLLACQAWHFVTSTFTLCGRRGSRYSSQTTCPTYIHAYIHAYIHTYTHTYIHTTHLVHTQLAHTYSSTHNLLHINPSPSLLSFLLSPCHLYLSFAACWKKLTCGVIRSFNLRIRFSYVFYLFTK